MMTRTIAILALAAAPGFAAAQQQADYTTAEFLKTAIQGNIAEVQLGTLAEQRASGNVRELADMIVSDHRKALAKSTGIAEDMGVTVPEKPTSEAQREYDDLAQHTGSEFGRQFVDLMVKNHQSTIEKYRSYVGQAQNGSKVKAYAENALPTLEKHLEKAQALKRQTERP